MLMAVWRLSEYTEKFLLLRLLPPYIYDDVDIYVCVAEYRGFNLHIVETNMNICKQLRVSASQGFISQIIVTIGLREVTD